MPKCGIFWYVSYQSSRHSLIHEARHQPISKSMMDTDLGWDQFMYLGLSRSIRDLFRAFILYQSHRDWGVSLAISSEI
jgi:hypothetical protein